MESTDRSGREFVVALESQVGRNQVDRNVDITEANWFGSIPVATRNRKRVQKISSTKPGCSKKGETRWNQGQPAALTQKAQSFVLLSHGGEPR